MPVSATSESDGRPSGRRMRLCHCCRSRWPCLPSATRFPSSSCPSASSPVGLVYLHFPRKNRLSAGIFHEPEQHVPVSQGSVLVDMFPPGRAFYRRARVQEIEQIPDVVLSKASPVIDGPFRAHESTAAFLAEVSFPAVRAYMPVADEPFRVAVRAFRRLRIVYHLDRLISPSAVFVSSKCRKSGTDHARYFREFRNPRKWEYR